MSEARIIAQVDRALTGMNTLEVFWLVVVIALILWAIFLLVDLVIVWASNRWRQQQAQARRRPRLFIHVIPSQRGAR